MSPPCKTLSPNTPTRQSVLGASLRIPLSSALLPTSSYHHHSDTTPLLRRSTPMRQSVDGAVVPLRRSSRLENRRRSRAEPYVHAQARRSSLRMTDVPHPENLDFVAVSMQDNMLISDCSYENELSISHAASSSPLPQKPTTIRP